MGIECAGQATATVKGNTKSPKGVTPAKGSAEEYVLKNPVDLKNPLGFSVAPPEAAPRIDSPEMQMRRASQRLMAMAGRGRRSAFLGEGYGPSALGAGDGTK